VLIGDPGRTYFPKDGLVKLAEYQVRDHARAGGHGRQAHLRLDSANGEISNKDEQIGDRAMREDGKIDYIEWPAATCRPPRLLRQAAFGWSFTDYGPDYAAFEGQGADGGFTTPQEGSTDRPLVVLYAHDIEAMLAKVTAAAA
jgi:hypothetical protein